MNSIAHILFYFVENQEYITMPMFSEFAARHVFSCNAPLLWCCRRILCFTHNALQNFVACTNIYLEVYVFIRIKI